MFSVSQTQLPLRSGRAAWFAVAVLATVGVATTALPAETAITAPLTVTLKVTGAAAVPGVDVVLGDPSSQLTVVVKNVGAEPVRLWKAGYSFGYRNLSFEVTDQDGKHFVVTRAERVFEKDYPALEALPAGASITTDVSLTAQEWQGLPHLQPGERRAVRMHAVYRSAPSPEAKRNSVWVGSVASEDIDVTLLNPQK